MKVHLKPTTKRATFFSVQIFTVFIFYSIKYENVGTEIMVTKRLKLPTYHEEKGWVVRRKMFHLPFNYFIL